MNKSTELLLIDASQAQRERLAFVELRAFFTGELRRSDIEARFGIKPAASSRDLALYKEIAPDNLVYDLVRRCYRPAAKFSPIFELNSDRVLAWLLQGFGDGLDLGLKRTVPCEGAGQLIFPNLNILGEVTRCICSKQALEIDYFSLSSGQKKREIVPVALADNGLRWHVRAFDRDRGRFGDFVLTRITGARIKEGNVPEEQLLISDDQWTRIVDMELVPHPGVAYPTAVEADYGMCNGVLRIKTRAALAGYFLRRWSVDSSEEHCLDPQSHHLWLRNHQTLYGVESATIAPGCSR
jgi:hypothetical protein